jgi:hypothetical protein
MQKAVKKKSAGKGATPSILRSQFHTFAKLVEQAGDGRPLLRGLRVAQDPKADRIVVVHSGARVEFTLVPIAGETACANVECRRIDSMGTTEAAPLATFRFDEGGNVQQASVVDLGNVNISEADGAWSLVAAVIWDAMQNPA